MALIRQFLAEIEKDIDSEEFRKLEKKYGENEIQLLDSQIEMLKDLFLEWGKSKQKYMDKLLEDVCMKPSIDNGMVYEALVYAWLEKHHIRYRPQVPILQEDCFKKTVAGYEADGEIIEEAELPEQNIIFDIKRFGITLPHIETLRIVLQEKIGKNYFLTIGGNKNISTRTLKKEFLGKTDQIIDRIFQEENKHHTEYIYFEKDNGIVFHAYKLDSNYKSLFLSSSSFDYYRWAQNNEFYFIYHASQFCRNRRYILFCSYDRSLVPMFSFEDHKDLVFLSLRTLCRRIFVNLAKMTERRIDEFDGKAVHDISVSIASRKISAIVFIDVSKDFSYEDSRIFVFQNPNADHKLERYEIDQFFRINGAQIEDFQFDNY